MSRDYDNEAMQDSPESKMDSAFVGLNESLERLGSIITTLEHRLTPVKNDNPRPEESRPELEKKPTGDSPYLRRLYSLKYDFDNQVERIQSQIQSLDI